jgi:hypothetical protein
MIELALGILLSEILFSLPIVYAAQITFRNDTVFSITINKLINRQEQQWGLIHNCESSVQSTIADEVWIVRDVASRYQIKRIKASATSQIITIKEADFSSVVSEGTVSADFINGLNQTMHFYWIDYSAQPTLMGTLPAHTSINVKTAPWHVWLFTDINDNVYDMRIMAQGEAHQRFTLSTIVKQLCFWPI